MFDLITLLNDIAQSSMIFYTEVVIIEEITLRLLIIQKPTTTEPQKPVAEIIQITSSHPFHSMIRKL